MSVNVVLRRKKTFQLIKTYCHQRIVSVASSASSSFLFAKAFLLSLFILFISSLAAILAKLLVQDTKSFNSKMLKLTFLV